MRIESPVTILKAQETHTAAMLAPGNILCYTKKIGESFLLSYWDEMRRRETGMGDQNGLRL